MISTWPVSHAFSHAFSLACPPAPHAHPTPQDRQHSPPAHGVGHSSSRREEPCPVLPCPSVSLCRAPTACATRATRTQHQRRATRDTKKKRVAERPRALGTCCPTDKSVAVYMYHACACLPTAGRQLLVTWHRRNMRCLSARHSSLTIKITTDGCGMMMMTETRKRSERTASARTPSIHPSPIRTSQPGSQHDQHDQQKQKTN